MQSSKGFQTLGLRHNVLEMAYIRILASINVDVRMALLGSSELCVCCWQAPTNLRAGQLRRGRCSHSPLAGCLVLLYLSFRSAGALVCLASRKPGGLDSSELPKEGGDGRPWRGRCKRSGCARRGPQGVGIM